VLRSPDAGLEWLLVDGDEPVSGESPAGRSSAVMPTTLPPPGNRDAV
jgi:hypothetical protein